MGLQFDVGRHVFENRSGSVIFYDGRWYQDADDHQLFGSKGAEQSFEIDTAYLGFILAFFDDPDMRRAFGLTRAIEFAKNEISSESDLDEVLEERDT